MSSLETTHVTFWSDSQIVLHWLSTTKKLKKFVSNRVSEINALTKSHSWKYCPTHDNPADLLTRGVSADFFMKSSIWQTGPTWITDTRRWPIWETDPLLVNTILEDRDRGEEMSAHALQTTIEDRQNIQNVMNVSNHSSYRKLLRVTALVQRFVQNCKLSHEERSVGTITSRELRSAERLLLQHSQATEYSDEITSLKTGGRKNCSLPKIRSITLLLCQLIKMQRMLYCLLTFTV